MHECILKHKRILSKISHKATGYITRPSRINDKNPRWFMFLYNERTNLNRICNRASLFDRIKPRVVTRDCLKSPSLHLHRTAIRVSCLCVFFRPFLLFPFFSFFFSRPLIHSKSQTRAHEYAAGNFSTMQKSLGRKVIYVRVRVFQTTRFPLTPQRDSFWLFSSGSASSPDIVGFH